MKPTDFLLLLIFVTFSCGAPQEGFLIEGNIQGLDKGKLLLQRRVDGKFITIDSCQAHEGAFTFSGKMEMPEMCFIFIADTLPYLRFFNENATISISSYIDSLSNPAVTGSASHQLLSDYNARMASYESQLQETYTRFRQATQEQDTARMNNYEARFDQIAEEQKAESLLFVGENTSSVVSAYLIWGTLAYDLEVEELEALSGKFSGELRKSIYLQQIDAYIKTLNKVAIGQPFTEIALNDTSGNVQRLSQLKGKLILIDFWASWCGPCRRENPRVVAMYNEFKGSDFEIFGVSLDEDRAKWIRAINDDGLTWYHVSDLAGWDSEAGKLYGVRSIPHTVLIDKNGIIIARNLRGDELREKIRTLTKG